MSERIGEKERFLQEMIRRIATGELASGTKLPTESELAEEYGIAKTNIHLGIKELERLGFVQVVPRHAVYIADMHESLTLDGVNATFRYVDGLPNRAVASALLELREMMAFGVMRWMTRHPDRAHMDQLRQCCTALEQAAAVGGTEAVYPPLLDFMRVFYHEAGNDIFPLLIRSFSDTMMKSVSYMARFADPVEMAAVYRSVLQHVDAGDVFAAMDVWAAWNTRLSVFLLEANFPL
ncbi:MAG: FadR family transcriptional regulator [Oscillospiraceae bacterium]|nr:FadR family transcriptional regulator [Oscillospiraceae bacterium]MBQ6404321.1 FadR family transcriptional regulator [Oscillospiraceae bacterium]